MIRKTSLPDSITLPCGAVLKPVIGGHVAGKRFIPDDDNTKPNDGTSDFFERTHNNAAIAEAKRRGLKFRRVSVLSRNLRGKLDLHGRNYTDTKWVFVEVKPESQSEPQQQEPPSVPVTIEFATPEDARNFLAYVEKAKAQEGTVTGVYAGIACSALKRARSVTKQTAEKDPNPLYWCAECKSYHVDPTSEEHHAALKCRRPWQDWKSQPQG